MLVSRSGKPSVSGTSKNSASWRATRTSSAKVRTGTRLSFFSLSQTEPCLTHRLLFPPAEQMRRMFYRWLSAARKARTKRLLLQEKEDQLKLGAVTSAWEKWRERFLDIKLQPMVSVVSEVQVFFFVAEEQLGGYVLGPQAAVHRVSGVWYLALQVNSECPCHTGERIS